MTDLRKEIQKSDKIMSEMKTILQGAQGIIDSNENMIMNVEGENK